MLDSILLEKVLRLYHTSTNLTSALSIYCSSASKCSFSSYQPNMMKAICIGIFWKDSSGAGLYQRHPMLYSWGHEQLVETDSDPHPLRPATLSLRLSRAQVCMQNINSMSFAPARLKPATSAPPLLASDARPPPLCYAMPFVSRCYCPFLDLQNIA